MTVKEIADLLEARVVCGEDQLDYDIKTTFSSDLMSDVLACVTDQKMLMTGLCNLQVVRTAEMMDMKCLLFVRDKQPTPDMIEMAGEYDMIIMCTEHRMFTSSGLLYEKGMRGRMEDV